MTLIGPKVVSHHEISVRLGVWACSVEWRLVVDIPDALKQLVTRSTVTFQSSKYLVGEVRKKAAKIDAERRQKGLMRYERKPRLLPVGKNEHRGSMEITPWELLHTLGRATVLAGQGSSRALSQHWSCLKYITTLQSNYQGRMELSVEGNDPKYHRKTVQAEDRNWSGQ